MKNRKEALRIKRHRRLRIRVSGSAELPRLAVHRSIQNLNAQLIDDVACRTLFSLSTRDKDVRAKAAKAGTVKASGLFGELFAARAKEKGFSKVVFDRAGYLFHGRIKAFAEGARKGGLVF